MKSGTANTTSGLGDSTTHSNMGPDVMTWASTWELMNRTLEAFATRTPTRVTEEATNPEKLSKNRKNSRIIQTDALTLG